jgi:LysR family transcriptional regulator for metE and metH
LEVKDLRVALALASAGSTAGAARLLHLSQPAVSRALLGVEDKLKTRLFDRTPRGLVATPSGERLLAGATGLLASLSDLELRVRTPIAATRLRIVCECYTAYHWLPSALETLRRTLPELEVSLEVEHTDAPVAALEAGEIDVALLTTSTVPRDQLEEKPLFHDEVVFVVSRDHPLASAKHVTRADLRSHTLLTSRNVPVAESHWFMNQAFGRTRPKLRFERLPLTEAIMDVARAGMGVAILSEWIASPYLGKGDLVAKRLSSGPLRRPWRFAYRRAASEAALRLYAVLAPTLPRPCFPA